MRSIDGRDIANLVLYLGGCVAATALPSRADGAAVEAMAALYRLMCPARCRELRELMRRRAGGDRDWDAALARQTRARFEDFWGRMREMGPRAWTPRIELAGEENVRRALETGRGAVLWCMRTGGPLAMQMAFGRAGLPLVHLSRSNHGAGGSSTRAAAALVSPLYARAEAGHVGERVLIPANGSVQYLQTLRQRLRENRCVSIFGEYAGRQNVEAPFLGGRRPFAVGAPSLAWLENSALLPVWSERLAPFDYRVIAGVPIAADRSRPRKQFAAEAVAEFARRMEMVVRTRPEDWHNWTIWDSAWERPAPS